MTDQIITLLANVVVAGGGAFVVAYAAVRHFGAAWLSAAFEKRTKRIEHEYNKDIERLRSELTRSLDRRSKLHQREFEVLPEVWGNVCDAYWKTRSLVHPFKQMPALDRMSGAQLNSFIDECELPKWQRDELRQTQDKTTFYMEKIFWVRLSECRGCVTSASNLLGKQGIFINKDTQRKLDDLMKLLWDALAEEEMNHQVNAKPRLRDDIDRLLKDGDTIREDVEADIRRIIWDEQIAA